MIRASLPPALRRSASMADRNIIYVLHRDDSQYVYIGKSCRGLKRPLSHRVASKRTALYPVSKWVAKHGGDYDISILETHETADRLNDAEIFYISYFRWLGIPLLNCTDGGEGIAGHGHDAVARAKISAAHKGRRFSPERRAEMSANQMGRACSAATRAKIAAAFSASKSRADFYASLKGREFSAEHRYNLSVAKSTTPGIPWHVYLAGPAVVRAWRDSLDLSFRDASRLLGISRYVLEHFERRLPRRPGRSRRRSLPPHLYVHGPQVWRAWRCAAGLSVAACARLVGANKAVLYKFERMAKGTP